LSVTQNVHVFFYSGKRKENPALANWRGETTCCVPEMQYFSLCPSFQTSIFFLIL